MTRRFEIGPVHFGGALILAVLLYVGGVALHSQSPKTAEIVQHAAITVAAVVVIELALMTFLARHHKSEIQEAVEEALSRTLSIVDRTTMVGLTQVYSDRDTALPDVMAAVKRARRRVWIHGVSLSNQLNIRENELMAIIADAGVDARVLLLDPTRSTSVYRALLEGAPGNAKAIVDAHSQAEPPAEDPLLSFPLFGESEAVLDKLMSSSTQHRVKFFGHAPSGWLLIADESAFFQPYTFGKDEAQDGAYQQTGGLMPVFRFDRPRRRDKAGKPARGSVKPSATEVLASHFDRVWRTSNCDYLMMRVRNEENRGGRILHDIFRTRADWLRHVVDELRYPARRASVRHPCSSDQELQAEWVVVAEHDEHEVEQPKAKVRVVDYCLGGLGFEVCEGTVPPAGTNLTIGRVVATPGGDFGTSALNQKFFGRDRNTFEVVWSVDKRLGCKVSG